MGSHRQSYQRVASADKSAIPAPSHMTLRDVGTLICGQIDNRQQPLVGRAVYIFIFQGLLKKQVKIFTMVALSCLEKAPMTDLSHGDSFLILAETSFAYHTTIRLRPPPFLRLRYPRIFPYVLVEREDVAVPSVYRSSSISTFK